MNSDLMTSIKELKSGIYDGLKIALDTPNEWKRISVRNSDCIENVHIEYKGRFHLKIKTKKHIISRERVLNVREIKFYPGKPDSSMRVSKERYMHLKLPRELKGKVSGLVCGMQQREALEKRRDTLINVLNSITGLDK